MKESLSVYFTYSFILNIEKRNISNYSLLWSFLWIHSTEPIYSILLLKIYFGALRHSMSAGPLWKDLSITKSLTQSVSQTVRVVNFFWPETIFFSNVSFLCYILHSSAICLGKPQKNKLFYGGAATRRGGGGKGLVT